jgi:integrase
VIVVKKSRKEEKIFVVKSRKDNGEGSTRKLENGAWECVIQSKYLNPKTGKQKRVKRQGKTETEARKNAKTELRRWEKEIEAGRDTKADKKKTFGQYMEEYIDSEVTNGITDSTYHTYIRTLRTYFYKYPISNYQLQMLNKVAFQEFYDTLSSTKSHQTCLFPRQLCIRCCKWLITRNLLDENYAEQAILKKKIADEYNRERELENKTRKQVFTYDDIKKFYYAYKNNMGQYPVIVLFLLETGMRVSEFASLRNENINLESGRIDIVETRAIRFKNNDKDSGEIEEYVKVPKNKEARFIMMSDLAKECVMYMQEQTKLHCHCNTEDLLYPTFRNGRRRTNATMEVCFKDLCDKLGIDRDVRMIKTTDKNGREEYLKKGLSLHALRHTADTIANTVSGANVVNTALKMGHKAISVENIYTHATEEGVASVATPSQIILDDYKSNVEISPEEKIKLLEKQIAELKKILL